MKPIKNILFSLTALALLFAVFYYNFSQPAISPASSLAGAHELADASQAAYLKLDAGMTRCTPAAFQLSGTDTTRPIAPLFENLGNHHFAISNADEKAQAFFNQGLRLTYAFNHAEAHRSFMEAARLAPKAAMAYWGQAYALGPNINDPAPDAERMQHAYDAVQKALKLAGKGTAEEKALIEALAKRYSEDPEYYPEALDHAYYKAMEKAALTYPDNAEVLTLYADAIMNTMPWNYWEKSGKPHPNTPEARAALEKAIALKPDHPGAHHLYIHMMELPQPDEAVPSAEKLASLMPGAGHLVHMPAHIFIRVGRYKDAVMANIDAIAADEDYISQCYSQGMYPLAYYPHNIHFLWSAATLLGDSKTAIEAAKKTAEKVPPGELANMPFLQDYASTPMLAYVRFGRWNDMLTIPYPGKDLKHMSLIWHYGRGLAFVRKGNVTEAKEELQAIAEMMQDPELEQLMANATNPSAAIARVAHEVVAGEIAAAEGDYDKAIVQLKKGIEYEDVLAYNEPAAWHIPVRQSLGAVLLKAGKAAEAELVYREDLVKNRNNGWSLRGLHASLIAQGRSKESRMAKKDFDRAWLDADVTIASSVY